MAVNVVAAAAVIVSVSLSVRVRTCKAVRREEEKRRE
jgi:hypothetical protein